MKGFQKRIGTPFFQLTNSSKEVTASTLAGGDTKVSLLDKNGNEIAPVSSSEASKARGDPAASSTVYVPDDGIYLFDVWAGNLGTAKIPTPSSQTAFMIEKTSGRRFVLGKTRIP